MASIARRFLPLFDRVLVSKVVPELKTASGIILPEATAKADAPNEGTVVSVGPGFRTTDGDYLACAVKEGDKVMLPEYGGQVIKMGEEEFFLFRDSDILGKLE